jgi:Cd2+/Zn2+-exporting ATPase
MSTTNHTDHTDHTDHTNHTNQDFTFHVQGLDCADCARTLETGIAQLEGVEDCTLSFATQKLRITGSVSPDMVIERVRALGYDVHDPSTAQPPADPSSSSFLRFLWQRRDTRLALLGAILILPGIIFDELLGTHSPFTTVTSLGALIVAGVPIARYGLRTLIINRQVSINMLMTIASVGAVAIGAYTEAGMVMVLFAIGEALEGYTTGRAREAIRSLMHVVPDDAILLRPYQPDEHDSSTSTVGRAPTTCSSASEGCSCTEPKPGGEEHAQRVPVAHLQVGDVILVKPGERIPMDGRVVAGASAVNQAPITGESRLIEKTEGADVFASSINGEGSLEVVVTRLAEDNTISRLIRMVEEAQEKRAPMQRFVDRFARYYTPAVVVIALLTALVPTLIFQQPFLNPDPETTGWLYRALALLVVACPCALVISTPVSIISAISTGAKNGVLVKGGAYLEALSRIKAIAFDKTGTLTEGKPSVINVRSAQCTMPQQTNGIPPHLPSEWCEQCDDMLALASAIEQRSTHPLAQAVINESIRRGVAHKYPPAEMVKTLTGHGVTGYVQGRQVLIGSHRYFDFHIPHMDAHCQEAAQDARAGYTSMMISAEGTYLGKITVSDTLRPTSREAIVMLKRAGVSSMVVLTGDDTNTAHVIGKSVGVHDVRAELLPEDKVAVIESLRHDYGTVAMVGDGINDAPALATADVGIAIGGASGGTAQAMETADITLMSDDLRQLPFAFRLSRAMMKTIYTNVALSIGIKVGFLALVLAGTGTMWMAVIADMGTSLLVTLNGMRLLRWKNHP